MKTAPSQPHQFAVCLDNEGCTASLEIGKIYRVVSDKEATEMGLIRIIDESGGDYAFSTSRFYPSSVPKPVEDVLIAAC